MVAANSHITVQSSTVHGSYKAETTHPRTTGSSNVVSPCDGVLSALRKNEPLVPATTWVKLDNTLSERSQTELII